MPDTQIEQQIMNEARQRLAASGGKPSQLPAMIQRVAQELEQRQGQEEQPNNSMDAYIDRVLQMSGMIGDGGQGGTDESAPTSAESPDVKNVMGVASSAPANAYYNNNNNTNNANNTDTNKSDVTADDDDDASYGKIIAAILAVGGTAALSRYLKSLKQQTRGDNVNTTQRSPTDEMIDKIDAGVNADAVKATELEPETKQRQLEYKQKPLVGDTPTNATLEDEVLRYNTDTFSKQQANAEKQSRVIEEAVELANTGNMRDAVRALRNNGVDIDDAMMRELAVGSNTFKSIRTRAGKIAADMLRHSLRP